MVTSGPVEAPALRPTLPVLSGRDVLSVLSVTSVAMILLGVAGAVAGRLLGGTGGVLVGLALAGSLGVWGGLWFTLVHRRGWTRHDFGFSHSRRSLWHLLWQVPLLMTLSLVGAALLGTLLGITPDGTSRQEDIGTSLALGPLAALAIVLGVVLVVPAAEEVLFRRVLLDWLGTRFHPALAVPLSAVVFALAHVAPAAMVYVLFLGLGTGFLRRWHGTLWAPLVLHAVNNGVVVLVALATLSA